MDQSLKIVLALAGVLVLFVIGYNFIGESPTVSAMGTSSSEVTPDIASVYLTVEARSTASAQDAQDIHKARSETLLAALKTLGLSESEIKTSYYNVGPEYDWTNNGQVLKGYLATQQIVIELKDFEEVVKVVDAAIDSGASVSSINFELSPEKQSEYKTQALKEASEDAKEKASATAEGLGKKLGKLVSVQSQDFNYGPFVYYARDSFAAGSAAEVKEAAININPTDLTVYANVQVTYKIR